SPPCSTGTRPRNIRTTAHAACSSISPASPNRHRRHVSAAARRRAPAPLPPPVPIPKAYCAIGASLPIGSQDCAPVGRSRRQRATEVVLIQQLRRGRASMFIDDSRAAAQDWDAVAHYLAGQGMTLDREREIRQFASGIANLNYLVSLDGNPAGFRR